MNYPKLNTLPHPNGLVDFIGNKTKNNYVNLKGGNDKNVIDSVHAFMCQHGIWGINDKVVLTMKQPNYVPDRKYHDISFVLKFYTMARLAKEAKEKADNEIKINSTHCEEKIHQKTITPVPSPKPKKKSIVTQYLANPNISHPATNPGTKKIVKKVEEEDDDSSSEIQELLSSSDSADNNDHPDSYESCTEGSSISHDNIPELLKLQQSPSNDLSIYEDSSSDQENSTPTPPPTPSPSPKPKKKSKKKSKKVKTPPPSPSPSPKPKKKSTKKKGKK